MYLLDSSSIITPFHAGKLKALGLGLGHSSPEETRTWLEGWYERGFSSGSLVIVREVYEEVSEKPGRPEQVLLKKLWEAGRVRILEPNDDFFTMLAKVDRFIRSRYEPHQAEVFLRKVDPTLVAMAKTHGASLVSEERYFIPNGHGSSGVIKGEPRLPFVAWAFEVNSMGLLQVLQGEARGAAGQS